MLGLEIISGCNLFGIGGLSFRGSVCSVASSIIAAVAGSRESNPQPLTCIGGRWGTWVGRSPRGGEWRGLGESRFRIGGKVRGSPDGALAVGS